MAIYLNEAQYGRDRQSVGFPHVLLCMGLVAVTRTWLYGIHLDHTLNTVDNMNAFAAFIADKNSQPQALFSSCNRVVRYPNGNSPMQQWLAEMQTIAGILGFHGPAYGFNTGIIQPADGTYVQYDRNLGQPPCRIFYKRNEKMTYTTQDPYQGRVYSIQPNNPRFRMPFAIVTATINPLRSNALALHEVDYTNQLVAVTL